VGEGILTRSWQAVQVLGVRSLGVDRAGVGHLGGLCGPLGAIQYFHLQSLRE
jgi:hypothetical protein